ncbi:unnamed protein product [Durusdinium trenchii]|uniref:Uncharacterized protein n=2 Tax=Durusdinium trenchii TaxID=1381693 RepID=A0ABP0M8V1_9DINO
MSQLATRPAYESLEPLRISAAALLELLSDSDGEEDSESAWALQQEWLEERRSQEASQATELRREERSSVGSRPHRESPSRTPQLLSAVSRLTRPAVPVPPLSLLSGLWVDSMDNFLTVDLLARQVHLHGPHGAKQLQLSNDRWGRLWCGNYVLQEVGYDETASKAFTSSLPPTCLAWRTTKWQISIWQRVEDTQPDR